MIQRTSAACRARLGKGSVRTGHPNYIAPAAGCRTIAIEFFGWNRSNCARGTKEGKRESSIATIAFEIATSTDVRECERSPIENKFLSGFIKKPAVSVRPECSIYSKHRESIVRPVQKKFLNTKDGRVAAHRCRCCQRNSANGALGCIGSTATANRIMATVRMTARTTLKRDTVIPCEPSEIFRSGSISNFTEKPYLGSIN